MGRLGLTSFGGPAGHIALMEHEAVRTRTWVSREYFLDMVALTNLIPGPNATEMAIQFGYLRAGWAGLLLAGWAFILPGALLSALLAWAYARYGALPQLEDLFRTGIHPVVLGIILAATWRLGRAAIRDFSFILWGAAGLAGELLGVNPVWILLAAGAAAALRRRLRRGGAPLLFLVGLPALAEGGARPGLAAVGLFFLKVGSLLFGSGMVLYAFIEKEVVHLGWLTRGELLDAIAVGQMTPGPVLSSATFIGWLLFGPAGAAVATLGVFLPSFFLMSILAPNFERIRQWAWAREVLAGVSAAVVGIILGVAVKIALDLPWDVGTSLLFPAALALLAWGRVPAWAVVLLGAAVGGLRLLHS